MSNLPMRDPPIGAGTWLVAGGVVLALGVALFSGINAASNLIVVQLPGALVKLPGSTAANLARLIAAFGPMVVDTGGGVYSVTVSTDTTASIPGAKVL